MAKSKEASVDLLPPLGDDVQITEQHRAAVDAEVVQAEEHFGSLQVVDVVSWSISEDKQTCMVVFVVKGDDGDAKFALTYPADKARWLAGFFADVGRAAAQRNAPQGQLVPHLIQTYDIGHSDQQMPDGQRMVGVTFDRHSPTEFTWMMGNVAAMKFCYELIERGVKPRLSAQEREMWNQVQQFLKMEVMPPPSGSRIIRPQ